MISVKFDEDSELTNQVPFGSIVNLTFEWLIVGKLEI